jgi:hypothetical protein
MTQFAPIVNMVYFVLLFFKLLQRFGVAKKAKTGTIGIGPFRP